MSGFGKDLLVFETTLPNDTDNVGAYIRGSDGTLIDQETANGKKALDVKAYLAGSTGTLITNTGTALDVNIASSTGGGLSVTGNVADDAVDSGNPVKVGTRAHSGVLTAISTTNDRADALSDMYRRLYINDSPNIAVLSSASQVDVTEAVLLASPLAGRRRLTVQNLGPNPIFIGTTAVTTATGIRVSPGSTMSLDLGENVPLHAIAATALQVSPADTRVLETA